MVRIGHNGPHRDVDKMTTFPGYIAWKSILPGPSSSGYSYITNDADLLVAEANAQPGSWKWFPVTSTNSQATEAQAAASWAGVTYNGTSGGSPSANIPDATSAVTSVDSGINSVGDFFEKLSEGNVWLRAAEALLGIVLIAVALGKITGAGEIAKDAIKVVK